MKKAGSTPRRTKDTSCDPQRQTVRSRAGEADPSGEENKPRESDGRPDREVRVELQGSELWKRFYEIGTEMIITKAGRYKMWIRKSDFKVTCGDHGGGLLRTVARVYALLLIELVKTYLTSRSGGTRNNNHLTDSYGFYA